MHGPKYPPSFVRAPPVSSNRTPTERRGAVPSLILYRFFQSGAWQHLSPVLIVSLTLIYVDLNCLNALSCTSCFRTVFVSFQPLVRLNLKPTQVFAFTFLSTLNVAHELNTVKANLMMTDVHHFLKGRWVGFGSFIHVNFGRFFETIGKVTSMFHTKYNKRLNSTSGCQMRKHTQEANTPFIFIVDDTWNQWN